MKNSSPLAVDKSVTALKSGPRVAASCGSAYRLSSVDVLGVEVQALNMDQALKQIALHLSRREKAYLCCINVHGVMEARRDRGLAEAYSNAVLAVPDGMPIAWVGRLRGHRHTERVAGPELMREVFLRPEFAPYSHFFYGGAEGVAEKVAANFGRTAPHAKVAGTFTPPFRELTLREESRVIGIINRARPDIIWVGIGTPKQDKFMQRMLPKLETRFMFGVGAAFDFHSGRLRDCPPWVKRTGLQWVHRLLQEPKRLWPRYLRDNPAFLWHIALQLSGLRRYTLEAGARLPEGVEKVNVHL
jgi:N-acetylglucosaminyldiphosphoundecaprenol N-acetyl-beta-D-mannosaminyltransferase